MTLPDPNRVISDSRQRSTEFTQMYQEVTSLSQLAPPREVYLRPSMFPVCSLTLLDGILHMADGPWDYSSDYFTSVGTTVHSLIERWVSRTRGSRLWGNWRCQCGERWMHTDVSKCRRCGATACYEEITIEYLGIKGHIDCILITPRGVLIGDYKTSTRYGVSKPTFREHNLAYSLQLTSYTYMVHRVWGEHFQRVYGVGMAGCSLLFISRDNPFNYREFTWNAEDALRHGRQTVVHSRTAWNAAKRSQRAGRIDAAYRRKNCEQPRDYETHTGRYFLYEPCHLKGICFSRRDTRNHFRYALKHGPQRIEGQQEPGHTPEESEQRFKL